MSQGHLFALENTKYDCYFRNFLIGGLHDLRGAVKVVRGIDDSVAQNFPH